ncbi:MAG: hypothetical protein K2Q22_15415 [Cytophagales bacterium]|nr:hypothetical protein [Cytophagales bacterium]
MRLFCFIFVGFVSAAYAQVKSTTPVVPDSLVTTMDVTVKLHAKLDTIAEKNKLIKYTNGYRIQVYLGNNKEESNLAKEKLYKLFRDANIYATYKQPDYKVKFGDYTDRLEVYYVLMSIRNDFPNALIIEEQVNIIR